MTQIPVYSYKGKTLRISVDMSKHRIKDAIVSRIPEKVFYVSNIVLIIDNIFITGASARNFYRSPRLDARVWFGTGVIFGVVRTLSSGLKIVTRWYGIPWTGWLSSILGRNCNRLGRYAILRGMAIATTGNISTPIIDLIDVACSWCPFKPDIRDATDMAVFTSWYPINKDNCSNLKLCLKFIIRRIP